MAAMEDVLDLYAEPYDPQRPVVCFDETSTQLLADVREPLPAKPGRPRREDYEYQRGGTRNLFLTCEPRRGWRHVAITRQRTMQDFAQQMRWLVDEAYPDVPVIRLVLDNLNTHRMASLYETFIGNGNGWSGGLWHRVRPAEASIPANPDLVPSVLLGCLQNGIAKFGLANYPRQGRVLVENVADVWPGATWGNSTVGVRQNSPS